jgi:hypothetical protein
MSVRDHRFFPSLTPLADAIDALPKGDPLNAELFAKDDEYRKQQAKLKRERRAQRNLKQREAK